MVEPPSNVPYEMSVCSAKSAAFSIGVIMRSTVRNAARFAVYDDIMINVKNHQIPPTILVDVAFGIKRSLVNNETASIQAMHIVRRTCQI